MSVKATISGHYRWRLGLMAALLSVFCVWFLYDGFVTYPKEVTVWEKHQALELEGTLAVEWPKLVASEGYPEKPKKRGPGDVFVQKLLGFMLTPFALLFLFTFIRTFGRWVALEPDGLATNTGHRIAFATITKLDKTRWNNKGIAVLHGQEGTLILDDWKFDRNATKVILESIEEHLSASQIKGDVAESEKNKDGDESGANESDGGDAPATNDEQVEENGEVESDDSTKDEA